jgi:hypothetical protein
MHYKQLEYRHCAGKVCAFQRLPGRCIASNLSTCTALARLVSFSSFLAGALQAYRDVIYPGKFNLFPAVFYQTHCKQFEYMHCAGKVSSFQRLPGRCITNNLSTCTALARLVSFSGFLANALQAYRDVLYADKPNFFPAASYQVHGKQLVYTYCASKVSSFQRQRPGKRIATKSRTHSTLASLISVQ